MKHCGRSGCDESLAGKRPGALYCSNACKVQAHKDRKAAAAEAGQETPKTRHLNVRPPAKRVYNVLKAREHLGATTAELCQPAVGGHRFSSYINELRDAGVAIDTIRQSGSSYRYVLRIAIERHDARRAA